MAAKNDNGSSCFGGANISKAATLKALELSDKELNLINSFAMTPLTSEEVFTFKAVLCDNEVDRTFEQFTLAALQQLQGLFVGKTVIKDHEHRADNQVARIYATELVQDGERLTQSGEIYTQLHAKCYMVKTENNADLIAEINAGIKKEGSLSCSMSQVICSICGVNNAEHYCLHYAGKSYEKDSKKTICTFTLDGATDAYEFSLVAVPAQKAAGVSKSYNGKTAVAPELSDSDIKKAAELEERIKRAELRNRLKF